MKSCLSSLILSSSFSDLVIPREKRTDRVRRKNFVVVQFHYYWYVLED